MQCVYRPADLAEAIVLKSMLADHNIDCHISGQYLQGAAGDLPVHDLLGLWLSDNDVGHSSQLINDYLNASPCTEDDWLDSDQPAP
jgi:hypothetical protein